MKPSLLERKKHLRQLFLRCMNWHKSQRLKRFIQTRVETPFPRLSFSRKHSGFEIFQMKIASRLRGSLTGGSNPSIVTFVLSCFQSELQLLADELVSRWAKAKISVPWHLDVRRSFCSEFAKRGEIQCRQNFGGKKIWQNKNPVKWKFWWNENSVKL